MKIKNISNKPIFIGTIAIMPDETKEFNEAEVSTSTIDLLVEKKLLEHVVNAAPTPAPQTAGKKKAEDKKSDARTEAATSAKTDTTDKK